MNRNFYLNKKSVFFFNINYAILFLRYAYLHVLSKFANTISYSLQILLVQIR